jgi:hypothetical protein
MAKRFLDLTRDDETSGWECDRFVPENNSRTTKFAKTVHNSSSVDNRHSSNNHSNYKCYSNSESHCYDQHHSYGDAFPSSHCATRPNANIDASSSHTARFPVVPFDATLLGNNNNNNDNTSNREPYHDLVLSSQAVPALDADGLLLWRDHESLVSIRFFLSFVVLLSFIIIFFVFSPLRSF